MVVAGWFESAQKPLAGQGDDNYHGFGNMLNLATESDGGEKLTPTESIGMQANLVGGITANAGANDPSVSKFSMEKLLGALTFTGAFSGATMGACVGLQQTGAWLSLGALALTLLAAFFGPVGGAAAVGSALIKEAAESAAGAAISAFVSGIIGLVAPTLARMALTEVATEVFGEDFGNMMSSYGMRYFGKTAQENGGAASSYDSALAMYREQQTVLAYTAEVDRATHSPFDMTNHNTFLGKISSSLAITSTGRGNSILGQIGSLGSLLGAMRMPITLSASAATELEFQSQINWDVAEGAGGCPRLGTIGAVGDMFCQPIRAVDTSTQPLDPEYVFYKAASLCDDDDNCSFGVKGSGGRTYSGEGWPESVYVPYEIERSPEGMEIVNEDSDLGKMIKYGVARRSDPGTSDANILNEGSFSTGFGWLDSLMQATPVFGEITDLISSPAQTKLIEDGWVNGQAYCAGCGHPKWESTYKWLDQYIVDTNIYENLGLIEKDDHPVSKIIAAYDAERNRTPEGALAANMGMPEEWVVETLAFADDLKNVPRDEYALVASAPNIYADYYNNGIRYNELYVPENNDPCEALDSMRECTQIAGTELRRRFNAEAVA